MYRKNWLILLYKIPIILILFLFIGCGYHFGTILITGESKISIAPIQNESYYSVENDFYNILRQQFYSQGIGVGKSLSTIYVNVKNIEKRAIAYSSDNSPTTYKMIVHVQYELKKGNKIIDKRKITDYGVFNPSENDDSKGIDEALTKISQKIVENLLEKW